MEATFRPSMATARQYDPAGHFSSADTGTCGCLCWFTADSVSQYGQSALGFSRLLLPCACAMLGRTAACAVAL